MIETIKISEIQDNPANPRVIKNEKFKELVASVKKFPKMLELRPIIINADNVVLGGNMRLAACKYLGMEKVPVLRAKLTPEQERELVIKDNVGFGDWDWDDLAARWDNEELRSFGIEIYNDIEPMDVDFPNVPREVKREAGEEELFMEVICPNCAHVYMVKKE